MKIVITEQQLKRIISEQPDSRFPVHGLSSIEQRDALSGKYDNRKMFGPNLDVDDYTDIVSGLLDVIPGVGNLVSGGIDITHGITYVVRFFFAKTFEEKVEMAVMAVITLGMAAIPVGGNAANMVARGEIKMLLKMTPHEILVMMKNMGLIKSAGFKLSKQVWKYSLLIALVKVCRGQLDNVIGNVSRTIASISNKSKDLKPYLDNFSTEIQNVMDQVEIKNRPINKLNTKPNLV
jgi:hypothetical protein